MKISDFILLTTTTIASSSLMAATTEEHQKSPAPSPSGAYILKVGFDKDAGGHATNLSLTLSVSDRVGRLTYKFRMATKGEEQSNYFWCWDKKDRVWLWSRSRRAVYYWDRNDGGWKSHVWQGDFP